MNMDDLRRLAPAEHVADTEPLTVTAYNLRRLVASHDALAAELGRLKEASAMGGVMSSARTDPSEVVHAIDWSEQSDIRFACDGAMSQSPWCADPKAATWRADNGRLFAREAEDVTCVLCHQSAARSRRIEADKVAAAFADRNACDRIPVRAAARVRSRWADTDALGQTIKGWVEAHGSERVAYGARAASDRQLVAALFDYRTAQGERDGLDARLVDVIREVESRLWRANGGAFEADERARVLDELSLEASESRPELRAEEAARYLARWGREPCLSDCACPECVPRGAEVERLKALHAATLAELNALHASMRPRPEDCALDLAAILARADAATAWRPDECDLRDDDGEPWAPQGATLGETLITLGDTYDSSAVDWCFVAHAREDVPNLIREVRRVLDLFARERAVRLSYEAGITWYTTCVNCAATLTDCRAAEERAELAEALDPARHNYGKVPDDVARILHDAGLRLRVTAVVSWELDGDGREVAENVSVYATRVDEQRAVLRGGGVGPIRDATRFALRALSNTYRQEATRTRAQADRKRGVEAEVARSATDDYERWAQEAATAHDAVDAAWPEVTP